MPAVFPGGAGPNVLVPNWEASGKYKLEYSRNVKSFSLPRWAAYKNAKNTKGKYLDLGASQATRIVSLNDHKWADGADRPDRNANLESFEWKDFQCERFSFPFHVGTRTADQAPWDLVPWHGRIAAQMAMTARTKAALAACSASAFSGSTGSAASVGGGQWSAATAANPFILMSCLEVAQRIHKATNGAVDPSHISILIDPIIAAKIRVSAEITDFIKQQQSAPDMMENKKFFTKWGIPKNLYGFNWEVEDTVINPVKKGATDAKTYVMGGDTVLFTSNLSNPEDYKAIGESGKAGDTGLPPGDDMPTCDTVTVFIYEDMAVENIHEPKHRRIFGDVVDDYGVVVTCPKSGFLLTDVLA